VTETNDSQITLTIEGARAARGVSLSDFEAFIDNFLAALRDYDRSRRGEPTRRSGKPDKRDEAVTAFRLVRFRSGSGVATIEPDRAEADQHQLSFHDVPLALTTLHDLRDDLAAERSVPEPVVDALGKACPSVGPDGRFTIELADVPEPRLVVDSDLLDRVGGGDRERPDEEIRRVSGRLHRLDIEPDRLGIRTANGAEWSCQYPEELEQRVISLVDHIVWVEGSGKLASPLRGSMSIERIEPVDEADQTALFTPAPVSEDELLARQGITAPQGIDALSDPEWDDDADDAYLAALLSK
jgi:hypothetical protein